MYMYPSWHSCHMVPVYLFYQNVSWKLLWLLCDSADPDQPVHFLLRSQIPGFFYCSAHVHVVKTEETMLIWDITLVLLNWDLTCLANSLDPDQIASEEASFSLEAGPLLMTEKETFFTELQWWRMIPLQVHLNLFITPFVIAQYWIYLWHS